MIDIVQRLRRPVTRVNAEVALLCEAAQAGAAEIERLRAELVGEPRAAWDAVLKLIPQGPLEGNGSDMQAQRNGLVLAANELCYRIPDFAPMRPSYASG